MRLYSDNKNGAVGELTGSGTAYTLLVNQTVANTTSTHLANRISGEGVTSSDISDVISKAQNVDGVFTLNFLGVAKGDPQTITVTVVSANGNQCVTRDADLIDAGLNSLTLYDAGSSVTETGIQDEIERQIKDMVKWNSDVEVTFSNEPDWTAPVGTGTFSYTVTVNVALSSDKGGVDGTDSVSETVTLRVSYNTTT